MNNAQNLLEKLGLNTQKQAVVEFKDEANNVIESFKFHFNEADFDLLQSDLTKPSGQATAIKDYLLSTVDVADKEKLLQIINVPTLAPLILKELNDQFIPKINVSLKA